MHELWQYAKLPHSFLTWNYETEVLFQPVTRNCAKLFPWYPRSIVRYINEPLLTLFFSILSTVIEQLFVDERCCTSAEIIQTIFHNSCWYLPRSQGKKGKRNVKHIKLDLILKVSKTYVIECKTKRLPQFKRKELWNFAHFL